MSGGPQRRDYDLRVAKGFMAGWMHWQDERYLEAALKIGKGLVEASVTEPTDYPRYPEGLTSQGFQWNEESGEGSAEITD